MVVAEEMGTDLRLKRLAGDDDGHDDGDDEGGLPAYSHNDKIPPWWEYVSKDSSTYKIPHHYLPLGDVFRSARTS